MYRQAPSRVFRIDIKPEGTLFTRRQAARHTRLAPEHKTRPYAWNNREADAEAARAAPLAQQLLDEAQLAREHKHARRAALRAGRVRAHVVENRAHRAQRIALAHSPAPG